MSLPFSGFDTQVRYPNPYHVQPGDDPMKTRSTGAGSTPANRLATARVALQRARAGHQKQAARTRAGEVEIERLDARAKEVARALDIAKATHADDTSRLEAWEAVADFAVADEAVAESEVALAETKVRLARHIGDVASDGDERARLEEAVALAEKKVEKTAADSGHGEKKKRATKAEARLEEARKAEAEQRRLAIIDQKLAQLAAASERKSQERKSWTDREKKVGEDLAKLAQQKKDLEAERKKLSAKA
jgi:hypothetical protein